MVTMAYYKLLLGAAVSGTSIYIIPPNGTATEYSVRYSNDTKGNVYDALGFQKMDTLATSMVGTNSGIHFGDGDTPTTINDYTLAGNRIEGLTGNVLCNRTEEDNAITITTIATITNGNAEPVTIREVAYTHYIGLAYSLMLDRTVLEAPVTIPAGGVGQVTYTIKIEIPTA